MWYKFLLHIVLSYKTILMKMKFCVHFKKKLFVTIQHLCSSWINYEREATEKHGILEVDDINIYITFPPIQETE